MPEMLTIKGLNVGMQGVRSDEDLTFFKQMGVEYVDASKVGFNAPASSFGFAHRETEMAEYYARDTGT